MGNFVIQCRYEYRKRGGVEWTDWFVIDSTHRSLEETKAELKNLKELTKATDRITKLKHEYREYDAETYENEYNEYLKHVEEAKNDFATIKRMKKPWAAKALKERKALQEMDNADKVMYLAKKRNA